MPMLPLPAPPGIDGRVAGAAGIIYASCPPGYRASHLTVFDFLADILSHIFHTDRRIREESRLGESEFLIRDKKVIAVLFFVILMIGVAITVWLNLE